MNTFEQLYIDGNWINSQGGDTLDVINPATAEVYATVPSANKQDVELAVAAAKRAFGEWSVQPTEVRAAMINAIADGMEARKDELIESIVGSMGCP
ncbi:MAG: aldehyde dehydrogenase family protein, partial [Lentilitoribacter sp.]